MCELNVAYNKSKVKRFDMETFCHRIKQNKKGNCDFLARNSDFFSLSKLRDILKTQLRKNYLLNCFIQLWKQASIDMLIIVIIIIIIIIIIRSSSTLNILLSTQSYKLK